MADPISASVAAIGSFAAANAGTIAGVSAATSAIGTGMSFFGQRQQAKAAEQAASYNARLAKDQAGYETTIAAENARRRQTANAQAIAAQRAAIASSGLAPTGTPLVQLGELASSLQQEIFDLGHAAAARSRALISSANMAQWEGGQQAAALRTSALGNLAYGITDTATGYLSATGSMAPTEKLKTEH
jgi:hypothetical protein